MTAQPMGQTVEVDEPEGGIGIDNLYQVPKKQWERWTFRQGQAFNRVFSAMTLSPYLYMHPEAPAVLDEHWRTTAWNAAWEAAEAAGSELPTRWRHHDET